MGEITELQVSRIVNNLKKFVQNIPNTISNAVKLPPWSPTRDFEKILVFSVGHRVLVDQERGYFQDLLVPPPRTVFPGKLNINRSRQGISLDGVSLYCGNSIALKLIQNCLEIRP